MAQRVALPPIRAGLSKRAIIARYRAALIAANHNIENTAECLAEINAADPNGEAK